ncbi:MAG: hypothetical protein VX733_06795 [Candidatus Latescibacterota bacterium]|nr:hypothetical protein [Candidatus Latescibacterota bacterium]
MSTSSASSVVVLYRGGRLPSWHRLTDSQRNAYQRKHVLLMLSVAKRHGLLRLDGFRLLAPCGSCERFWVMEFPALEAAEAWMAAEVAPPYGSYGHYEYLLARRLCPPALSWMPQKSPVAAAQGDPHVVPDLRADSASIVVLGFGGWEPDSADVASKQRGDDPRWRRLRQFADSGEMIHGELFQLIGRQADWSVLWLCEFTELSQAERWIEADCEPPWGAYSRRRYELARRWAPAYFNAWLSSAAKNSSSH